MTEMKRIALFLLLVANIGCLSASDYVVTTTADSGPGTLRYAMQMCASAQGPHNISFNIPITDNGYDANDGVWVIIPLTDLPLVMKEGVTIDGTTQTQFGGDTNPYGPEIVIDGGGNRDYGLRFMNAGNAVVRGLNIRRFTKGMQFYNSPNSCVTGCYIGTDHTASTIMANDIGLEFISNSDDAVIGGQNTEERNIVSGNLHIGIRLLDVKRCKVTGCYIGTDRTGSFALPNYDGMSLEGAVQQCIIGGTEPGERNLISGNTDYGLPLFGVGATQNVIVGNYIGTDVTGTMAIGNTYGVLFDDGSFGNRVGGDSDDERNIISGNVGYGVFFYNNGTNSNTLRNNYIGTDYTGLSAVPNAAGIIIDGISYSNIIDKNIISGNLQSGIGINITGSDNNVITRNKIGINAYAYALSNGMDGIRISQGPKGTVIGGSPEMANVIAYNGGCGVYITNDNCTENLISCNSFYGNGSLSIDLFEPGVNPNDTGDNDSGANNKLNYPEITSIEQTRDVMHIEGFLDTQQPELCEVQVYIAWPDPSGYGEGYAYGHSVTPDNNGHWQTDINMSGSVEITTLAIDAQGNTSEFGATWNNEGPLNVKSNETSFYIYPNPTCNILIIKLKQNKHNAVSIYDTKGSVVYDNEGDFEMLRINVALLPNGIYNVVCNGESRKLIVRK